MGASRDDFVKYPRTPHLFGSTGTEDDTRLGPEESLAFIADPSLIVEEKLDGTNVGIHFTDQVRMVLQCRGHYITEGMHPQYDLFKQWCQVKRPILEAMLADRYILYGEWLYAKHNLHYRRLPHYFFEFDIYDKITRQFLDLESRLILLEGSGMQTVPILHRGALAQDDLAKLITNSRFDSLMVHPATQKQDHLMEGLYLRSEKDGYVTGRAKFVRPEFITAIQASDHWKNQPVTPNLLAPEADLWS